MSRAENKQKLITFLETIRRPDVAVETVGDNDDLVNSGLVDSLALLEIITFLETEFGMDFSDTGIDSDQLSSIANVLDLIERRRT
jgi:acyl carrier protein